MHFFLGSYYQTIFKKSSLKTHPQDELHVLLLVNSLGNSSPEALPGPLLGKGSVQSSWYVSPPAVRKQMRLTEVM